MGGKQEAARAVVQARMEAGEYLPYQAFMEAGLCKSRAHAQMKRWHDNGVVHVHHYERNTDGPATPYYAWGAGRDAPKPRCLTRAESARRYRKNHPDVVVHDIHRLRAKRLQQKPPAIDPLMAALMGVRT